MAVIVQGGQSNKPRLIAVLLNPPLTTSGNRTRNAVAKAASVLAYKDVEIVNLCSLATQSVVELNAFSSTGPWLDARSTIVHALAHADGMLAGWGITGTTGVARQLCNDQVAWLYAEARASGLSEVWMVGGKPRHPSRWHQYVSDQYARTTTGAFEDRLSQVLQPVAIAAAVAHRNSRRATSAENVGLRT